MYTEALRRWLSFVNDWLTKVAICTDFETSLREATTKVLRQLRIEAKIIGWLFHFSQEILRKYKEMTSAMLRWGQLNTEIGQWALGIHVSAGYADGSVPAFVSHSLRCFSSLFCNRDSRCRMLGRRALGITVQLESRKSYRSRNFKKYDRMKI